MVEFRLCNNALCTSAVAAMFVAVRVGLKRQRRESRLGVAVGYFLFTRIAELSGGVMESLQSLLTSGIAVIYQQSQLRDQDVYPCTVGRRR